MRNPKTTIVGYLALVSAVCTLLIHSLSGAGLNLDDLLVLSQALAGVGLIAGRDGSH